MRRIAALLVVIALGAGSSIPARAASLSTTYSYSVIDFGEAQDLGSDVYTSNLAFSHTSSIQPEFSLFVQSDFGVNKIHIETARYGPGVIDSVAQATSSWQDNIVILGGTGTGTATFQQRIDGELAFSALSSSPLAQINLIGRVVLHTGANYNLQFFKQLGRGDSENVIGSSFENGILTRTFEFTYGTPFSVQSTLQGNGQSGGIIHFGGTILSGFILPTGASLASDSGALYAELVPIPEPQLYIMMLFGIGVLFVVVAARRRTHSSSDFTTHRYIVR